CRLAGPRADLGRSRLVPGHEPKQHPSGSVALGDQGDAFAGRRDCHRAGRAAGPGHGALAAGSSAVTSGTPGQIAQQFEANRGHLRAVAYRMLGSLSDADDVVQDAWLRLTGSDTSRVENLKAWLTTVVARLCLDALRSRKTRDDGTVHVPDPIVSQLDRRDPEHEALLADSVSLAVLVVLETLGPDERLAFVLHDMFDVPFSEIARIVRRSPAAARQLASRARRRVRGAAVPSSADLARQREVIDAFVAAARAGDFEALIAVLDPDV